MGLEGVWEITFFFFKRSPEKYSGCWPGAHTSRSYSSANWRLVIRIADGYCRWQVLAPGLLCQKPLWTEGIAFIFLASEAIPLLRSLPEKLLLCGLPLPSDVINHFSSHVVLIIALAGSQLIKPALLCSHSQ